MSGFLRNKQIIIGITGGISAYKSADLVRRLREEGAIVRVVMTENAKQFITPLTLQAVSGHPIHDDLFDRNAEAAMGHIELAKWADAILIAPASADCIAELAQGNASDLLTTLCLATTAPIAIAPAMNQAMWKNSRTQKNIFSLMNEGIFIFGPGEGSQACGDVGFGRLLEPLELIAHLDQLFSNTILSGKKILITTGPTHEAMDPIRFITNKSSGKMGQALAEAAREAGAEVTLIRGPVNLPTPSRMQVIDVVTAEDMYHEVLSRVHECDIFISAAAVADYHCKNISSQKIKKNSTTMTVELELNPDILQEVANLSKRPFIVGFAAESETILENAANKLRNKKLNMIIANEISNMGSDENTVTVLWEDQQKKFDRMSKQKLARELIQLIAEINTDKTKNEKEMLCKNVVTQ